MKILVIFHDAVISSGATQSMYTLLPNWIDSGVEVEALIPGDGDLADSLNGLHIKTHIYKPSQTRFNLGRPFYHRMLVRIYGAISLLRMRFFAKKMARTEIVKNVDAIYSNTSVCLLGYYLQQYTGIPHVWHLREFGDLDQNTEFVLGRNSLFRRIDKANLVVAISKSIMQYYRANVPNAKMVMVYDDLSPSYSDYSHKRWNEQITLLSCGSLNPGKGHMDVIKAVALLRNKGTNVFLKIAGSGKMYEELHEKIIDELDVRDRVEMLGQVSNMKSLREECQIAVVASRMEAFGRVTLEAMLGGMTVIGANSGGTAELIKNNQTGLLFEVGNIDELASCVEKLIENHEEAERLADNGYAFAQQFIQGNCAANILNAVKETLSIV